jgi:endonuclease/exonuclease/phosphatase family metal-dependent hydrolase
MNATPDAGPVKLAETVLRDSETVSLAPHEGPEKTFNGFQVGVEPRVRIDYLFVSGASASSVTRR